jgi:hypothetical protein
VMKEDPGTNKKTITKNVKVKLQADDDSARLSHSCRLPVQGEPVRNFEGKEADMWPYSVPVPTRANYQVCSDRTPPWIPSPTI